MTPRKFARPVLLPLFILFPLFLTLQPAQAAVPAAQTQHAVAASATPSGIGDWLHQSYCKITRSC